MASATSGGLCISVTDLAADVFRGKVTGLAYHPSEDIAATVGLEGKLRLWVLTKRPNGPHKGRHWHCKATTSYQGPLLQTFGEFDPRYWNDDEMNLNTDTVIVRNPTGCAFPSWRRDVGSGTG
jgi:hypothetical protein